MRKKGLAFLLSICLLLAAMPLSVAADSAMITTGGTLIGNLIGDQSGSGWRWGASPTTATEITYAPRAAQSYTVFVDIEAHCSPTGPVGEATEGTTYTITLRMDEGYALTNMFVWVDNDLLSYSDYTYSDTTGELSIPGSKVTGDIVITALPHITTKKAIENATAVTLPYNGTYELGTGELIGGYHFFDASYGIVYKMSLLKDEEVCVLFYSANVDGGGPDTCLIFFRLDEYGDPEYVDYYDNDELRHAGESYIFTAPENGDYYVFCLGLGRGEDGLCNVSIQDPEGMNRTLDFTQDPVPTGDLWSWDAASTTLRLKDGFSYEALLVDERGIALPAGATMIVEGKASITSVGEAIQVADGDLDVRLLAGAELTLESFGGDGIECLEGELTITGDASGGSRPRLIVKYSNDDGLDGSGISVTDMELDITSSSEGIKVDGTGDIELTNCVVRIVTGEEGLDIDGGVITLNNCDVWIDSTDDEEGIEGSSDSRLVVTGGRLVLLSKEECIDVGSASLQDVAMYLRGDFNRSDAVFSIDDMDGFSLPGRFRLYDIEHELMYEGAWDDSLIKGHGIGVVGEDGVRYAYVVATIVDGDRAENRIEGVTEAYTQGEDVLFEAIGGGLDNRLPVDGNTRWAPVSWEVSGLSGDWADAPCEASFSTADLALGEHTLAVTFRQERYVEGKGWCPISETDDAEDFILNVKTVTFNVTEEVSPDRNSLALSLARFLTVRFVALLLNILGVVLAVALRLWRARSIFRLR